MQLSKVNDIYQSVIRHIFSYQSVLLAFSGGLDSTVLLNILFEIRENKRMFDNINNMPNLRAVYVNHGVNKYSNIWSEHCKHACHIRNIMFSTVNIFINKELRNVEETLRNARYQQLLNMLTDNEALLTAQNKDDQVETILMAIKRGSGPLGLSGMQSSTLVFGKKIVRPLLQYTREELKLYAISRNLNWIEDDNNTNLRFERNFLRHKILPILLKRWPNLSSTITRSAKLCFNQEKLLDELLNNTLEKNIQSDGSICLTELLNMSDIKRSAILRRWLIKIGVRMPSYKKLLLIWKEVALSKKDSVAKIQIGNYQVRKFRNALYVIPNVFCSFNSIRRLCWLKRDKNVTLPLNLGVITKVELDSNNDSMMKGDLSSGNTLRSKLHKNMSFYNGMYVSIESNENVSEDISSSFFYGGEISIVSRWIIRAPNDDETVSIRFGYVNGSLRILGRQRSRKLKKIWQEFGIPPWQRKIIPLLFYNDQLITAIGVFITMYGKACNAMQKWSLSWKQNKILNKSFLV